MSREPTFKLTIGGATRDFCKGCYQDAESIRKVRGGYEVVISLETLKDIINDQILFDAYRDSIALIDLEVIT